MELGKVLNEAVFVLQQNVKHRLRLVGICHKDLNTQVSERSGTRLCESDLEDVKGLVLNVAGGVAKEVHGELEVVGDANKLGHCVEVGTIQQNLTQKLEGVTLRRKEMRVSSVGQSLWQYLERLSLCNVVLTVEQFHKRFKELHMQE